MKPVLSLLLLTAIMANANAQEVKRNVPYVKAGHERHVLDIYTQKGINADLGKPDDPTTKAMFEFVANVLKK